MKMNAQASAGGVNASVIGTQNIWDDASMRTRHALR